MNHVQRFKVKDFAEGVESVVGECNGYKAEERFRLETPIFARAIISHISDKDRVILDYGCGVGRLAKEILKQTRNIRIIGLDASPDERRLAMEYVNDARFSVIEPEDLTEQVDMIYSIYVLQHIPAIELRQAIERMHYYLKPKGKLVYCSSDFRLAISLGHVFTDDTRLGVFPRIELSRLFIPIAPMFDLAKEPKIIRDIVTAEGLPKPQCIPHPAIVYERKDITVPYFNVRFD